MTRRKRALGRGLESLFPGSEQTAGGIAEIDLDAIEPNPFQPRRNWDEDDLQALADSIRDQGLLQPIVVRRAGEGYQLIAGERRVRAAAIAGLSRVPAVIRDADDSQMLALALIENVHRRDLDPIEKALALRRLVDEFELTQADAGDLIGMSRPAVSNLLRLLELPEEVMGMLRSGAITMGHARALLSLDDQKRMIRLARRIDRQGMSVRQVEAAVREGAGGSEGQPRRKKRGRRRSTAIRHLEEKLQRSLKTKVRIDDRGGSGKIEISYSSLDELDRILEAINR